MTANHFKAWALLASALLTCLLAYGQEPDPTHTASLKGNIVEQPTGLVVGDEIIYTTIASGSGIFGRFALSRADGTFSLNDLPGGHAEIIVKRDGFAQYTACALLTPQTELYLHIELVKEVRITGRVLNHKNAPSSRAKLEVFYPDEEICDIHTDIVDGTTQNDGTFELTSLRPHTRISLYAKANGQRSPVVTIEPVASGILVQGIELHLKP